MSKVEDFKSFVKDKPHLFDYIKDESMSWQKFYEIWDIMGPEDKIWQSYGPKEEVREEVVVTPETSFSDYRLKDFANVFKNMNMEKVQSNITSIQKGIGFLQDFFLKDEAKAPKVTPNNPYVPRATGKIFED